MKKKVKVRYTREMATVNIFWEEAIKQVKEDYTKESRKEDYDFWISVIKFVKSEGTTFTLSIPSLFFKDQLTKRGHISYIQQKLFEISGQNFDLNFEINAIQDANPIDDLDDEPIVPKKTEENSQNVTKKTLNSNDKTQEYTFNSFIFGDNNSFAYNAALAVAKNPGHAYNPLLIYGGVGLGKTHLMCAIGNYCLEKTDKRIIYVTAEEFTNEYVSSVGAKTTQKFKNKYRNADVLLIDDIHFFQNKESTQEELFHTFNALYDSFKQIVFTCDRPISELKNLEDRLRSRFERGLNVDLSLPSYETRRAILEKKLSSMGKQISNEVIDYIAQNVASNIRDLEAALTRIIAYTDIVGKEVTLEIAQQELRDKINIQQNTNIGVDTIIKTVADYYGLSVKDIKGPKRSKNVMLPRQLAMYIVSELTEYSTTEIGGEFGGRDHTTVMHSVRKIDESLKVDSSLDNTIQILIKKVKEYKK